MPEILHAEKVHDCLSRVRYKYRLSSPVTKSVLEAFSTMGPVSVTVYDAKTFLPGSKVIFQIHHCDDGFLVAGAFGLDYLTVTYSKSETLDSTMSNVEGSIRCL